MNNERWRYAGIDDRLRGGAEHEARCAGTAARGHDDQVHAAVNSPIRPEDHAKLFKGLFAFAKEEIEEQAMQQLKNIASLPFIHKHIAVMPDVHLGKGATIGSVIPTLKAVIPAAVGVDIGCGMIAAKTTLTASDLPDNLREVRAAIETGPD